MTAGRGRLHWLASFIRNLVRGKRVDAELDDNVRSYLDLLTDEKVADGMAPEQARRVALLELGGIESAKEQTRSVRAGAWIAEAGRDVRYALRMLRRAPTFTIAAVATLALGIGANTAVFSVVHGVLLRDLPYGSADRLVRFQNHDAEDTFGVSEQERLIYAAEASTFQGFSTYYLSAVNMTGTGDAERLTGALVDPNIFETLDVNPVRGRLLQPDDAAGGPGVVTVLAEEYWRRRFAADETIIGRTVTLNGRPLTIVGVLPDEVKLPGAFTGSLVDFYLPLAFAGPPDPENIHYLEAVARLADERTLEQAGQAVRIRATEVRQQITRLPVTYSVRLIPLDEVVLGDVRQGLLVVWLAVGLLLLVACGNLAGLLLARAQQRTAELSLRAALGASSSRLVRQMLTEGLLLALTGGAAGAALAMLATRALVALEPGLPRVELVGVDGWALAFTAGLSIATGLIFGLWPALMLSRRRDLLATGGESSRATTPGTSLRARRLLIAAQVALSVALAIGAGLLARSASALAAVPPGFEPTGALAMRVTLPAASYPDQQAVRRYFDDALAELRVLPGVAEAGATTHLPLVDRTGDWGLTIEGLPERDTNGRRPNADWSVVSAGYFETMGVRVVEGRTYGPGDVEGAPLVTVINERMAREYFPGQSPIGRRMRMTSTLDPADREIIGVVADIHHEGLAQPPNRQMFLPLSQFPASGSRTTAATFVVRSTGDPTALVPAIRSLLRARDPNVPVALLRTMDDIVASSTAVSRLYLLLLGVFSGLATAIVSVGVYGVAAYLVTTRRRELAVRRALGASPRAIVGLVLREGTTPVFAGIVIGVAGALAFSEALGSLLFSVTSRDPITFAVMPLVVTGVTVAANLLPARWAVRENLTAALRI